MTAFVDLAPLAGPELVPAAVAAALRRPRRGQPAGARRARRPDRAPRGAARARQLRARRRGGARSWRGCSRPARTFALLVTSRSVLHVLGEHEVHARPARPGPAAEVFVERARQVRPDSRARRGHPAGRPTGGFTSRRDPARDRARRRPGPAAPARGPGPAPRPPPGPELRRTSTGRPGSRRCGRRSAGATRCSGAPSARCCDGCRSSPAASRWRPRRRWAGRTRSRTFSTRSPPWSVTASSPRTPAAAASPASGCSRRCASSRPSGSTRPAGARRRWGASRCTCAGSRRGPRPGSSAATPGAG